MSGFMGMNDCENSDELNASRKHVAKLLNEATPKDLEPNIDSVPVIQFGYYKGEAINVVSKETLALWYFNDVLEVHPECKEWVEKNVINKTKSEEK
ncbi:MAG: hypothetical protein ABJ387_03595 [Balneola sp.]